MQAANFFQALRNAVSAHRKQSPHRRASSPTSIAPELLGSITGGKGDQTAPTTTPSLPKHTW